MKGISDVRVGDRLSDAKSGADSFEKVISHRTSPVASENRTDSRVFLTNPPPNNVAVVPPTTWP